MNNLKHYLRNPFDNADVSLDNLLAFTLDHVPRMTANNPGGIFADRITATTKALNGVEENYSDDKTADGLKKAKVKLKDGFRASLSGNIGKIYSAVAAKYSLAGAELDECFPKGRTMFTHAKDSDLGEELQTLVNGVTAHQADLGADVVAQATSLLAGWQAVLQNTGDSKGGKAASQTDKASAKSALALELFKNLLTLAQNFPGQPDKLDVYMQGSLLEPHTHSTGTTPTPAPPTTPSGK